ncbi:MAG: HPr family phosphocarrier protein [Pseudobutyrivibrio sp.]|nr:HPr family phosphocarrier protein [Pseudobutyrivibrio sp.]
MKFKIYLKDANDAAEFVAAASQIGADIDLHSGVVYIDGKSLLGVLAMGVKREMNVLVSSDTEGDVFKNAVSKFAVA